MSKDISYQNKDILFKLVPLMKSTIDKATMAKKTIELSKEIKQDFTQAEVVAGLLTVADKFIDKEYAEQVMRWLDMTQVGRLFEEEKQEAVEQAKQNITIEIAKRMLKKGKTIEEIEELTLLSKEQIMKLN